MVIKLYVSGISGNKEVKKKQQRVQMILDSKQITYEAIDITEPGKEKDKEFMQQNGKVRECLGKYPLPPQIFNDDDFCGDYEDFDLANEVDELEKFLHIATSPKILDNGSKQKEESGTFSEDDLVEKGSRESPYNPYDYHTIKIKWDSVNGQQEQIIDSTTGDNDNESEQIKEVNKMEVNGFAEDEALNGVDKESDVKVSNEDISAPVKEDHPGEVERDGQEEEQEKVQNGENETSDERINVNEDEKFPPTEDEKVGGGDEEENEKESNDVEGEEVAKNDENAKENGDDVTEMGKGDDEENDSHVGNDVDEGKEENEGDEAREKEENADDANENSEESEKEKKETNEGDGTDRESDAESADDKKESVDDRQEDSKGSDTEESEDV